MGVGILLGVGSEGLGPEDRESLHHAGVVDVELLVAVLLALVVCVAGAGVGAGGGELVQHVGLDVLFQFFDCVADGALNFVLDHVHQLLEVPHQRMDLFGQLPPGGFFFRPPPAAVSLTRRRILLSVRQCLFGGVDDAVEGLLGIVAYEAVVVGVAEETGLAHAADIELVFGLMAGIPFGSKLGVASARGKLNPVASAGVIIWIAGTHRMQQ